MLGVYKSYNARARYGLLIARRGAGFGGVWVGETTKSRVGETTCLSTDGGG